MYDTREVRKDFPILDRRVGETELVYLDNAATSQKPRQVLDTLNEYYEEHNANIHRGVHRLAEEATALYEGSRQRVARFLGAPDVRGLIFIRGREDGTLDMEVASRLIGPRTKMVGCIHSSNVLATVNPVERLAELAHSEGALMLVDGAQSAPHMPVDVASLGCDFFACSGHKMLGPTGVGVLWGRPEILDVMDPC